MGGYEIKNYTYKIEEYDDFYTGDKLLRVTRGNTENDTEHVLLFDRDNNWTWIEHRRGLPKGYIRFPVETEE